MSSGPVVVPWANEICWMLGVCNFLHETAYYIIPPFFDLTLRWAPAEEDRVYLIFALSFGKPRNYVTGEVIYTDEIGFWHRGRNMLLHWDPLVESLIGIVYPHITPATKEDPFEIRFVNRTEIPVIMDVSVWFFSYTKRDHEKMLEFLRGITNLFRVFGRLRFEDAEALVKKLAEAR